MRIKGELERYYDAAVKKWLILAFLCAVSISFIFTLIIFDWQSIGWSFPAAIAFSTFGAVCIYALFYEWHLLPPRATKFAVYYENIIHMTVARSRFLKIEDLNRRITNLIVVLVLLIASSALSWLFPMLWYLTSVLIGGFSGVLASYQIEEEINAPNEFRQGKTIIFSLFIFALLSGIGWLVSELGPKYGNEQFGVYWVYISAAFACGVLITFLISVPKIFSHYRNIKLNKSLNAHT